MKPESTIQILYLAPFLLVDRVTIDAHRLPRPWTPRHLLVVFGSVSQLAMHRGSMGCLAPMLSLIAAPIAPSGPLAVHFTGIAPFCPGVS